MAGNQLASDLDAVMAAVESTYGTDATPSGDGLDIRGDITMDEEREIVNRARIHATQGRIAHGVINKQLSYSFQVAVAGVENVDSGEPGVHPLLVAGGLSGSKSGTQAGGDVQIDYTPLSYGRGSCSMYRYLFDRTSGQQIRIKLLGCRHNLTFDASLNGELLLTVEGRALYAEWEAAASLTNPTGINKGNLPFVVQDVTHTLGGTDRRVTSFSLATNWQLGADEDVHGSESVEEVTLHRQRGNDIGGSIDPVALSTDFATNGFHDESRDADEQQHIYSFNDGTYTFKYDAPKVQLDNIGMQKANAFYRYQVPFMCNENSGNDDFTLTFGLV